MEYLHGVSTMKSSRTKILDLSLITLLLLSISCSRADNGSISTTVRFLSEDCSNSSLPHSSYIPSNIVKFEIKLYKNEVPTQQQTVQYGGNQSYVEIDDIEPYDKYKLIIRAFTKDNDIWSGYAEDIPIKPKSKTFVQINLSKEKSLTCTDTMHNARFLHSSVLLENGNVLVFGGATLAERDYDIYHLKTTEMAEIYYHYKIEQAEKIDLNVIAGTFSTISSKMISGRIGYTYEILPDGKILIAGGVNKIDFIKNPSDFIFCLPEDVQFVYDVEIFDPTKNTFSVIAKLNIPRAFAQSAIIGNKTYIIGGINSSFDCNNVAESGINSSISIIDISNLNSPKVEEKDMPDAGFFAFSKLKLSDNKYIFYGGNKDYALLLNSDESLKKLDIEVSSDFEGAIPQKQYFPNSFSIKTGSTYLNTSGYYKDISPSYFINVSSNDKVTISRDNTSIEKSFGSAYASKNGYFIQLGGINSIPIIADDSIIIIKSKLNNYELIDNNSTKLKRERAFASSVFLDDFTLLTTGGVYFDTLNDAVILNISEIYNLNGILK